VSGMELVIRADGGRRRGAGHVMRCLAVAEAAHYRGWPITLSADLSELSWVQPWVADLQVRLVAPCDDAAELAALTAAESARAVLLDHYEFPPAMAEVEAAGAVLVSLEDDAFGRQPAHVAVDYRLGAETAARPDDGSQTLLRGSAYAPVRRQFRMAAVARAAEGSPGSPLRVAVVAGGTDPSGLAEPLASAVTRAGAEVLRWQRGAAMVEVLATADAVISTAGVSSYELCCLGLPIALVEAADNQRDNYRALTSADAATGLGTAADVAHDPAAVTARLLAWFEDTDHMLRQAAVARELVDGFGADRIVEAIASRLEVSRG